MNDHEAMDAINAVLDQWFKCDVANYEALTKIARISGMNRYQHEEQK